MKVGLAVQITRRHLGGVGDPCTHHSCDKETRRTNGASSWLAEREIDSRARRRRAVGKLRADTQCHTRFIGWPDDDSDDDSWKAILFVLVQVGEKGDEAKKRELPVGGKKETK